MALNTTPLPIVAIGGINETNIPALSATGAWFGFGFCHLSCRNPTKAAEYLLSLMD